MTWYDPENPAHREFFWAVEALDDGNSLLDFVLRITPHYDGKPSLRPNHLKPFGDWLAGAAQGIPDQRGWMSIPPRFMKTETGVVHGIPWYLSHNPSWRVLYGTHTLSFAREMSSRARDKARTIGLDIRSDTDAKHDWKTVQGGGCYAVGVGGSPIGRGFNLILVDDPFASREEAESPVIREKVWNWLNGTLLSRLEPGGCLFIIMARWHPEDLIGRVQKGEIPYQGLTLPAILDENTPAQRSLCPERWTLEQMLNKRREVGSYVWASQYMGQPVPPGGRLFVGDPMWYERGDLSDLIAGQRRVVSWDPAATEKQLSDNHAIIPMVANGYQHEMKAILLDCFSAQTSFKEALEQAEAMSKHWGAVVGMEAVGGFAGVVQAARLIKPSLSVYEIHPQGDKRVRALPFAAAYADKRVYLPRGAAWTDPYLQKLHRFTGVGGGEKDDEVDASTNGYNELKAGWPPIPYESQRAPNLPFG